MKRRLKRHDSLGNDEVPSLVAGLFHVLLSSTLFSILDNALQTLN